MYMLNDLAIEMYRAESAAHRSTVCDASAATERERRTPWRRRHTRKGQVARPVPAHRPNPAPIAHPSAEG